VGPTPTVPSKVISILSPSNYHAWRSVSSCGRDLISRLTSMIRRLSRRFAGSLGRNLPPPSSSSLPSIALSLVPIHHMAKSQTCPAKCLAWCISLIPLSPWPHVPPTLTKYFRQKGHRRDGISSSIWQAPCCDGFQRRLGVDVV
jgi:hypothetical protein